ncbi:DUF2007 domain-containing protein [Vibrio sp. SM6]|uniref:DUF2007 domain-containing protein n=1 Tax=Vibrio agarilyticus TaxID=2726741 RepID=A0A7X8YEZ4_9VIBR|nr:DUF2007 domain-containing protein [Vibrio agarilyticus]NLS11303.1 DUF2007 domain-containing protein [Vibrio agarilyticus]
MKLYIASTPPEAHILCDWLKAEQIDCEVRGEGIFSLQGELPFGDVSAPYVWLLKPEQAIKAHNLLAQWASESSEQQKNWRCASCGEENERQFALCWHCGSTIG